MSDSPFNLKLTELSCEPERRREVRQAAKLKVTLSVPGQATMEVVTKDQSFNGISFITAEAISLGQDCHVVVENADRTFARFVAKVIRSREMDGGQREVAVQFRRQIAA